MVVKINYPVKNIRDSHTSSEKRSVGLLWMENTWDLKFYNNEEIKDVFIILKKKLKKKVKTLAIIQPALEVTILYFNLLYKKNINSTERATWSLHTMWESNPEREREKKKPKKMILLWTGFLYMLCPYQFPALFKTFPHLHINTRTSKSSSKQNSNNNKKLTAKNKNNLKSGHFNDLIWSRPRHTLGQENKCNSFLIVCFRFLNVHSF